MSEKRDNAADRVHPSISDPPLANKPTLSFRIDGTQSAKRGGRKAGERERDRIRVFSFGCGRERLTAKEGKREQGDRRNEGNCGSGIRASMREIPRALLSVMLSCFARYTCLSSGSTKSEGDIGGFETRIESRFPSRKLLLNETPLYVTFSFISRYHTRHCV